jgi:acyl dehydratase
MDTASEDEVREAILAPIGRTDVVAFAAAAADHNPLHLDDDFARAAGQEAAVAHGMLTLSRVVEVVLAGLGPKARAESIDVRFPRPLPLDRPLHLSLRRRAADQTGPSRVEMSADDGGTDVFLLGSMNVVDA